jgi:hypothetical protein
LENIALVLLLSISAMLLQVSYPVLIWNNTHSYSPFSIFACNYIVGRMEVEALVALRNICNPLKEARLVDLNLSDNALGAPGVESCRAVLSGKLLRAVKVCNCGLSAEVILKFCRITICHP